MSPPSLPRRAIFLAPHYDDVALSCGGTVALLADAGAAPLVVTVFGGDPGESAALTGFARWQHERWGTAEADTLATRRAEDRAAAALLGCETRWLPYLDAIYRGERYLSDEALFGPLAPDELPLSEQIAADVLALLGPPGNADRPTLYVPLAVGNHVDHQLVYQAGRLLAARGETVLAYEDYPYAALGDELARRLATTNWVTAAATAAGATGASQRAVVVTPIAPVLDRRIAAIAAYRTQLPVIFRFTDDPAGAIAGYARAVGNGDPAERFWPLL